MPVTIIAEAGVNHNGSLEMAKEMARAAKECGADIVKYAVTPQCARDVLTLLDATLTMQEEHNETPVITMSMGGQGAVSRVCGSVFGSSITFGTAGNSSAPGQLPADLLSTFINNL